MKIVPFLSAPLLAACGSADPAANPQVDDAFHGQVVDGALQPVAARVVMVGNDGREADACGALAAPASGALTVHWSNSANSPTKAQLSGDVWACQTDGAWTGVIFPADGQSTSDCNVGSPVNTPREYQGPCRWGWVESNKITITAG